jgi:hypothetical protein
MIPLLPYKQLVFESPLSQEEVIQRLTPEVAKPRSGLQWLKIRTENFEGTVSEAGFQIRRIIRHRNAFRPVIYGRFSPSAPGVRIEITMKLPIGVLLFSLVWLSFVGGLAVLDLPQMPTSGSIEGGAIGWVMLLIFYVGVTISFGSEANKASKLLSRIFEVNDSL